MRSLVVIVWPFFDDCTASAPCAPSCDGGGREMAADDMELPRQNTRTPSNSLTATAMNPKQHSPAHFNVKEQRTHFPYDAMPQHAANKKQKKTVFSPGCSQTRKRKTTRLKWQPEKQKHQQLRQWRLTRARLSRGIVLLQKLEHVLLVGGGHQGGSHIGTGVSAAAPWRRENAMATRARTHLRRRLAGETAQAIAKVA